MGVLGRPGVVLEPSWGRLGRSSALGPCWVMVEGRLGAVFGLSWAVLGLSWGVQGRSWGRLGGSRGDLGAVLGGPGGVWGGPETSSDA